MKLAAVNLERNGPITVLKAGLKTVRHHTKGWLLDDLVANGTLDGSKEALYAKIFADYQAQQVYIRAQKDTLGEDFHPLVAMKKGDFRLQKMSTFQRTPSALPTYCTRTT